jgi:hypothetical protein
MRVTNVFTGLCEIPSSLAIVLFLSGHHHRGNLLVQRLVTARCLDVMPAAPHLERVVPVVDANSGMTVAGPCDRDTSLAATTSTA